MKLAIAVHLMKSRPLRPRLFILSAIRKIPAVVPAPLRRHVLRRTAFACATALTKLSSFPKSHLQVLLKALVALRSSLLKSPKVRLERLVAKTHAVQKRVAMRSRLRNANVRTLAASRLRLALDWMPKSL